MADKNQCYTIDEVTELLKITSQTLMNWRKLGKIKVVKVNRKVLVPKEEIEKLLKENEI